MIPYNAFTGTLLWGLLRILPPADFGSRARAWLYGRFLKRLGRGVRIHARAYLFNPSRVSIDDDSLISYNAYLGQGDINIGKGCIIGPFCALTATNHKKVDGAFVDGVLEEGPITIGDHAWLGSHTCVVAGVTIGEGAVIGAGSVVTRDIPAHAVAVGAPARVIKPSSEQSQR